MVFIIVLPIVRIQWLGFPGKIETGLFAPSSCGNRWCLVKLGFCHQSMNWDEWIPQLCRHFRGNFTHPIKIIQVPLGLDDSATDKQIMVTLTGIFIQNLKEYLVARCLCHSLRPLSLILRNHRQGGDWQGGKVTQRTPITWHIAHSSYGYIIMARKHLKTHTQYSEVQRFQTNKQIVWVAKKC